MYRRDSLIILGTVSGITDVTTVDRVLVLLENGDYKEIVSPETMHNLRFEWTPEETAEFPVRRLGVRLIVELTDGRRFTIAESRISIERQFKEVSA
jgi:hypothetical protein